MFDQLSYSWFTTCKQQHHVDDDNSPKPQFPIGGVVSFRHFMWELVWNFGMINRSYAVKHMVNFSFPSCNESDWLVVRTRKYFVSHPCSGSFCACSC